MQSSASNSDSAQTMSSVNADQVEEAGEAEVDSASDFEMPMPSEPPMDQVNPIRRRFKQSRKHRQSAPIAVSVSVNLE